MKTYIIYGLGVLALVYYTSSRNIIMINWASLLDDGDSYYRGYGTGGGYHK